MSAYVIFDVEIRDMARYQEFMKGVKPAFDAVGARYRASASRPCEQALVRDAQALVELLHHSKAQWSLAIHISTSETRPLGPM